MKANRPYFLQIAARNLKHGGQRAVLAILCIVFGVMSFVGMYTVAKTLQPVLLLKSHEILGGDFTVNRNYGLNFTEEHVTEFEKLKREGKISEFTMIAGAGDVMFKTKDSAVWHYPKTAMGVDTRNYPIAGNFTVKDASVKNPVKLLEQPQSVLLTADLTENYKINVGDEIVLSDISIGKPVQAKVVGILIDTPNHEGSKVYFSYDVARQIGNGELNLRTAIVNGRDYDVIIDFTEKYDCWAWNAQGMAESRTQRDSTFQLMFNSAGGIGLLVGGIGVANTMIVLISRRRKQIATWKLLGYENGHIRAIFMIEALLMGLIGSIIGAGLGVLLSKYLTRLFLRTATWLVMWQPNVPAIVIGLVMGILTALLFALWAILRAANVSPAEVLRSEEGKKDKMALAKSVLLLFLMGVPYLLFTAYIIGSVVKGSMYMGIAIVILVLVCFFMAGGIWFFTALLPTKRVPQLFLARQHLRRDGITPIMAGAALFVGVLVILFSALAVESSKAYGVDYRKLWDGPNLVILAPAEQESQVLEAVKKINPIDSNLGFSTKVKSVNPSDPNFLILSREKPLEHTILFGNFETSKGIFVSDQTYIQSDGDEFIHIHVDKKGGLQNQRPFEIEFFDGKKVTLDVVGTYEGGLNLPTQGHNFRPILMNNETLKALTKPDQLQYYLTLSPEDLKAAPEKLAGLSDKAIVVNIYEWFGRMNQGNHNFFMLGLAMAALAFSAGFVLIANSVSLAILNRRYEIGVLKCVGYSRGKIMASLVLEYLIVGATAFLAAFGVSEALLLVIRQTNDHAAAILKLPFSAIAVSAVISLLLTSLAVIAVAWRPIQVSPTIVLSDRE